MLHSLKWLLLLLLAGCSGAGTGSSPSSAVSAQPGYATEVIVRTGENFQSDADILAFVEAAANNRVSAIHLLVKQDEDGAIGSGHAFYASDIAPRAAGYTGFDVLAAMLQAAHARQIKVWAWIPQFHDQVAALGHPDWQMRSLQGGRVLPFTGKNQREYFVNPLNPQAQEYELSIVQEVVRRYPVDGVMLDWIRFDDYAMDLGDATRAEFRSRYQIDPINIDFTRDSVERQLWNNYRTDGIAAYAQRVRQALPAEMPLGVFVLPPEFVEVAQDAGKFNASIQLLSPMCYYADWGYPLNWLWSSCMSSAAAKAGRSALVPAMDTRYTDGDYQAIFTHLRAEFPQVKRIAWFHHGRWDAERMRRVSGYR